MLSAAMAWNAGCPYSHAALVFSPGILVDARPPQVLSRSLYSVLDERPVRMDLFRPRIRSQLGLTEHQQQAFRNILLSYVGTPFALRRMPGLAWRTLLRRGMPSLCPAIGWSERSDLTCCELVYLSIGATCGFALERGHGSESYADSRQQKAAMLWDRRTTSHTPALHDPPHLVPADLITADLLSGSSLQYIGSLIEPAAPRIRIPV